MSILIVLLSGCSNNNAAKVEKTIKYREKNAVRSVSLDDIKGNIRIIGWGEDFIEINTTKKLQFGLPSDINLFDTVFFRDNSNELLIRTKIPARLNARIDLTIYVPFVLPEIIISQELGSTTVEQYLGNLNVTFNGGTHKIYFAGDTLRLNSRKSHIDLDIGCDRPADIILLGDGGDYNVRVGSVIGRSFLDFSGQQTNLNMTIADGLSHSVFAKSTEKRIHLKYKPDSMDIFNGSNMAIRSTVGENVDDFVIDINAVGGRVTLQQSKSPASGVE